MTNKKLSPLEALESIKSVYVWLSKYAYGEQDKLDEKENKMFGIVEATLKALEIIKDKCEFVFDDDTRTVIIARNGIMIPICHWDGKEYDLLKEALL